MSEPGESSVSILDVFFPKTFNTNFLVNAPINGKKYGTLSVRTSARRRRRNLGQFSSAGSADVVFEGAETREDTTVSIRVSDESLKTYRGSEPKSDVLDLEEANSLYVWDTTFLQPNQQRREADFFAFLKTETSDWTRRFLGVYYEVCVYHALRSYFSGGIEERIANCNTLVQNDMQFVGASSGEADFGAQNLEQVIKEITTKALLTWNSQLLARDGGKLRDLFNLEYQQRTETGGKDVFPDFTLKPKNKAQIYVLFLTFKGIGNIAFRYKYNREVTVEMKSLQLQRTAKTELAGKAVSNIDQAKRELNDHICCLLGLFKFPAPEPEAGPTPYGKFAVMFKQDTNGTQEEMEFVEEYSAEDKTSHVCHFVGIDDTSNCSTTVATNIWTNSDDVLHMYFGRLNLFLPIIYSTPFSERTPHLAFFPDFLTFEDESKVEIDPRTYTKPLVDASYGCLYVRNRGLGGQTVFGYGFDLYIGLQTVSNKVNGRTVKTRTCSLYMLNHGTKALDPLDGALWPEILEFFEEYCNTTNLDSFQSMNSSKDYILILDPKSDDVFRLESSEYTEIHKLWPSATETLKMTPSDAKEALSERRATLISLRNKDGNDIFVHTASDAEIGAVLADTIALTQLTDIGKTQVPFPQFKYDRKNDIFRRNGATLVLNRVVDKPVFVDKSMNMTIDDITAQTFPVEFASNAKRQRLPVQETRSLTPA